MNTIAIRRPSRNLDRLHPLAPVNRTPRPFGVGLLDEPLERLPRAKPSPPGMWNLNDLKFTPAVEPVEQAPAPVGVPSSVSRIAIIFGDHRETFRAIATTGGRGWQSEAGKTWVADSAVTKMYQAGRLAILKDAPTPAPVVEMPRPSREDDAWRIGFSLGKQGEDAAPRAHWPESVRKAFTDGFNAGELQRDRDEAEWLDAEADRYSSLEAEWIEPGEYHEMRISPPRSA